MVSNDVYDIEGTLLANLSEKNGDCTRYNWQRFNIPWLLPFPLCILAVISVEKLRFAHCLLKWVTYNFSERLTLMASSI